MKNIVIITFFICNSIYSQNSEQKIVLEWTERTEFKKNKLTICIYSIGQNENFELNIIKKKICPLCKNYEEKIILNEKKIVNENSFNLIKDKIRRLDIKKLNEENNIIFFIWYSPIMKLSYYENDIQIINFEYVSPQKKYTTPIALVEVNKIAKEILILAGLKYKKYVFYD